MADTTTKAGTLTAKQLQDHARHIDQNIDRLDNLIESIEHDRGGYPETILNSLPDLKKLVTEFEDELMYASTELQQAHGITHYGAR